MLKGQPYRGGFRSTNPSEYWIFPCQGSCHLPGCACGQAATWWGQHPAGGDAGPGAACTHGTPCATGPLAKRPQLCPISELFSPLSFPPFPPAPTLDFKIKNKKNDYSAFSQEARGGEAWEGAAGSGRSRAAPAPRAPARGPTSQPQKKKKKSTGAPGSADPGGLSPPPLTSLGRGTSDKNQASACSARTAAGSVGTVRTKGKRHGNCVDSPAPKVRMRWGGVFLLCSVCF